ncbi:MAG TPA: ureidoglycolate lyase [Gaiellales bacterium]|nr:ureidoglycolate lyase [Gaiellales bacterium]
MSGELVARPVDPDAFAPYGVVVQRPARAHDAEGPGWRWWAETAGLPETGGEYGIGFLALEPAPLRFDWAERHLRSPELVLAIGGDCLVYVAEATPGRHEPGPFAIFRLQPGQGVILAPGVWHGAPLSAGADAAAMVLLRRGTGAEDTAIVRFADAPVTVAG